MSPPDAFPRAQPLPADLSAALLSAAGRLGPFGSDVRWYEEVASTNDLAAALAERGAGYGTIVIADAQTAGRGRQGRSWCSPPGAGLYTSIVLRPHPDVVPLLTIAAGVAVVEGIREATGLLTALKWPNDVMIPTADGRATKIGGILVEATLSAGPAFPGGDAVHPSTERGVPRAIVEWQGCILGLGINVRPAAYPPDVTARATSLERELGRAVDRGMLLVECIGALARRYDDLQSRRAAIVIEAWRTYARPLLGRTVEWNGRDGVRRGVAEDIDASGALLVRTQDGTTRVISGDVRWI